MTTSTPLHLRYPATPWLNEAILVNHHKLSKGHKPLPINQTHVMERDPTSASPNQQSVPQQLRLLNLTINHCNNQQDAAYEEKPDTSVAESTRRSAAALTAQLHHKPPHGYEEKSDTSVAESTERSAAAPTARFHHTPPQRSKQPALTTNNCNQSNINTFATSPLLQKRLSTLSDHCTISSNPRIPVIE